jgi:site-specific recombinase XerD
MNAAIQEFERYLKRRFPGSATVRHYVSDLRVFQRFIDKPPRDVTRQDVSRFVEDQLGRGHTATTVNRRLASLRRMFEFLAGEADDATWSNPVVWQHHRVKGGMTLPRDISDANVERLFAAISHSRDRLMFDLMCWAGLRVGEVAALRTSDIIANPRSGEGIRLRVRGKGQKERVIPLTVALTRDLETWLSQRPEVESDALFITRRKSGISERGIQDRLAHYSRQAGVKVSCHQLRHTFGRRMAEGQMPLPSLSKMLGHAHVTTSQAYIAGAGVDVRADYEAAMDRLEAACPGSPLFPAAWSGKAEGASLPPKDRDDRDAGGSLHPETLEAAPDLSRFWVGLPDWVVQPLADYIAHRRHHWKPSQVQHHTRVRLCALCPMWRWLLEERGVTGIDALGRRDVEAYVEARLKAGIAASTLNRQLRDLWALLRFVEEQGHPVSPAVFRIPRLKEPKSLPRFLSEQAYRQLEEQVLTQTAAGTQDDRMDRAWFYLLAYGGLRLGELCDLRVEDVDLAGRRLMVREGKGRRDRVIPLSQATVTVLGEYLAVRGEARTDHLVTFGQAAVKPRLVRQRLARYGMAIGLKVWPHRLRHTLATRLVNTGMPIVSIQRLLGHDKLETTMIYARVHDITVERDFRLAMARLEAAREAHSVLVPAEPIPLAEQLFSHHKSASMTIQAANCV